MYQVHGKLSFFLFFPVTLGSYIDFTFFIIRVG